MAARLSREPPRDKDVLARMLKAEMLAAYSGRDAMIDECRLRRYQEQEVSIPEGYKQTAYEVRLPILRDHLREKEPNR